MSCVLPGVLLWQLDFIETQRRDFIGGLVRNLHQNLSFGCCFVGLWPLRSSRIEGVFFCTSCDNAVSVGLVDLEFLEELDYKLISGHIDCSLIFFVGDVVIGSTL